MSESARTLSGLTNYASKAELSDNKQATGITPAVIKAKQPGVKKATKTNLTRMKQDALELKECY